MFIKYYANDARLYPHKDVLVNKDDFRAWAKTELAKLYPSHTIEISVEISEKRYETDDSANDYAIQVACELLWQKWYGDIYDAYLESLEVDAK